VARFATQQGIQFLALEQLKHAGAAVDIADLPGRAVVAPLGERLRASRSFHRTFGDRLRSRQAAPAPGADRAGRRAAPRATAEDPANSARVRIVELAEVGIDAGPQGAGSRCAQKEWIVLMKARSRTAAPAPGSSGAPVSAAGAHLHGPGGGVGEGDGGNPVDRNAASIAARFR
jgi:hypothetical protein